jgi:hypothetical protein
MIRTLQMVLRDLILHECVPLEPCLNMLMLPTAGRNSRLSRRRGEEDRPRVVPSGQKMRVAVAWNIVVYHLQFVCGNFIAC